MDRLLMLISDENMRKKYRLAILFQKGLRDRTLTFLIMQVNKRQTNTFLSPLQEMRWHPICASTEAVFPMN